MATDETAVADRTGGGTAVDHRKDPLDPRDMDLSGEEHVPKVQQRRVAAASSQNLCAIPRVLTLFLPRLPDRPGAEAVHDHEAAGEVDGGRAPAVPGGPAAARSRLAPHPRYVPTGLSLSVRGRSFFVRTQDEDKHSRSSSPCVQSTSAPRPPCKSGATRRSSSPRSVV